MNSTSIIVRDVLKMKSIVPNSFGTIDSFCRFLNYKGNRMMFVVDGVVYTDSTHRFVKRDGMDHAKIEKHESSTYYLETKQYPSQFGIEHDGDILTFISRTTIPFDVLASNCIDVEDFPPHYVANLNEWYDEISPAIDFLVGEGVLFRVIGSVDALIDHATKIRDFINDQLNK